MQLSDLLAQRYQRLRKRREQASWANQLWGRSGLALGATALLNWNRGPPPCNNGQPTTASGVIR